ncbi:MAG: hypothetical protein OEY01_13825 [Desulfobulbaceae bacterium]|nr:hypothetical protein [Desulfobulbaceae bacterium]HIJ79789.1 hypothetical protein [Deltaproteobacteria bacterium]
MLNNKSLPSANLVGFSDIKRQPISDWQVFLEQGNQFLATASKAFARQREVFTPEILYNLVAMAIEKLIMALLMKSGNLPYNHTMHDLVESMEEFLPGRLAGLGGELKGLDAFQEICEVDNFTIRVPAAAEVAGMLALARKVQELTLTQTSN